MFFITVILYLVFVLVSTYTCINYIFKNRARVAMFKKYESWFCLVPPLLINIPLAMLLF